MGRQFQLITYFSDQTSYTYTDSAGVFYNFTYAHNGSMMGTNVGSYTPITNGLFDSADYPVNGIIYFPYWMFGGCISSSCTTTITKSGYDTWTGIIDFPAYNEGWVTWNISLDPYFFLRARDENENYIQSFSVDIWNSTDSITLTTTDGRAEDLWYNFPQGDMALLFFRHH